MSKELISVEWLVEKIKLKYDIDFYHIKNDIKQAKKLEKQQRIDLLTKYHDRLFFIPLQEGEAERIYNHLINEQ
jgi:hypothetical protein